MERNNRSRADELIELERRNMTIASAARHAHELRDAMLDNVWQSTRRAVARVYAQLTNDRRARQANVYLQTKG